MSPNFKKNINWKTTSWFCLVVFVLDRIFKSVALEGRMFFYKNYGIAFSLKIPENFFLYFYILVFLILVFLIYFLIKSVQEKNKLLVVGCMLLVVGCVSNLIDRIKFGFIIDYLNFYFFYNNLADCLIILGIAILIWKFIRK